MSRFFMKKKVMVIIVGAIVAVMVGLIIGTNIVNTMKTREKLAEKAKIEKSLEERAEIDKKIQKAEADKPSEEENYSDEYKEYEEKSDEDKANDEVIPRKEKIDYSEIKIIEEDQKEDLGKEYVLEDDGSDKEVLPKYFNLKDKIKIVVEDQGSFGLCWDFASLKSVETNLALTKGVVYDFSEGHVDYLTSNLMSTGGRDENCGGNFSNLKSYNESFKGFVMEEDVPLNVYDDYEYNTFYNIPKEDLYITKYVNFPAVFRSEEMTQEEYDARRKEVQTAVKTHIMNYGSIYAVINAPDYGMNHYIKNYEDVSDSDRGSHAISIVGWDDNYSRDNFTSPKGNKPQKDGAYIALNSWGENWGDNGYFYISYEDYSVNNQMTGVVSINVKSDLIRVNGLSKDLREYILDSYSDKIIKLDGEEYINEDSFRGNVDLSNRNIKDINDFELVLKRAFSIDLSNNNLESIDGLEKYIVEEGVNINLSNNNIKDVSCLKNVKINSLVLDGNYGVTGFDELDIDFKLSLADCGLTSFNVTDSLRHVCALILSGNNIEDYQDLLKMENLYYLKLDNNNITSLEDIKDILKMVSLEYLSLANNNLKDISGLEETTLYNVDLSYNTEIKDFEPLRKAKSIYNIILKGCNITDAKDVILGTLSEEDIEKIQETIEYEYDESISGIKYDLSENKNISNLKSLKNASEIVLQNCDLTDISELKELKHLSEIDLTGNHNITGDLTGMDIDEIIVKDCGLDNSFNVFNVNSVGVLNISQNNIDNYDNFISKVQWVLYVDSYEGEQNLENGAYITEEPGNSERKDTIVEIEIPNEEDLKFNMARYMKMNKINVSNVKVNGVLTNAYELIPVNKNTVITCNYYSTEYTTIKFKVNANMKKSGIEVLYNPYMARLNNAKSVDQNLLEVAEVYGNYIFKETNQFEIVNATYKVPARMVTRDYGNAGIGHIFIREKYYAQVKQDNHVAKFTVGQISGAPVVEVNDVQEEENHSDEDYLSEDVKLTFTNEKLYRIAKDYWGGIFLRCDDDLLTIDLKEEREENDSGLPMYIPRDLMYDVAGLKPVIVTDIYILMDMENGMDRIEAKDLKVLENFPRLKNIHIITPPEEYNELDLIIPQDKYVVTIENGVG